MPALSDVPSCLISRRTGCPLRLLVPAARGDRLLGARPRQAELARPARATVSRLTPTLSAICAPSSSLAQDATLSRSRSRVRIPPGSPPKIPQFPRLLAHFATLVAGWQTDRKGRFRTARWQRNGSGATKTVRPSPRAAQPFTRLTARLFVRGDSYSLGVLDLAARWDIPFTPRVKAYAATRASLTWMSSSERSDFGHAMRRRRLAPVSGAIRSLADISSASTSSSRQSRALNSTWSQRCGFIPLKGTVTGCTRSRLSIAGEWS